MPHRTPERGAFGRPAALAGSVVRLLPDYAGSVLWFPEPVDYTASCLDCGLVSALIRWEIGYYDSLDADFDWQSPALATAFTAEGVNLAMRVAVQLGSGFDVEFASYEAGVATRRFRSEFPADNPAAAAAFTALAGQAPTHSARPALIPAGAHSRWAGGSSSVI